jgi:hypothetical protein
MYLLLSATNFDEATKKWLRQSLPSASGRKHINLPREPQTSLQKAHQTTAMQDICVELSNSIYSTAIKSSRFSVHF